MKNSAEFQMNFINRIAFTRYGGTEKELEAANIVLDELQKMGGNGKIEEFPIAGYSIEEASFEITEPFSRKIAVTGIGRSGSTDGTIEAELFYAENGEEENFTGAEGKIVLINSTAPAIYKRLTASGALGFIVYSGSYHDNVEETDLDQRMLRPRLTDRSGKLPGVCMRTADAIAMLKDGAKKVKMTVKGRDEEHTSRNVVAYIEGSTHPEKEFLFTAHYDSTIYGLGSWDNATGSANILDIYRHFLNNPPKHSMRFIWCGSEEQGLLGSRAYVATHPEELEQMLICLNFDMTGVLVGRHRLLISANDEVKHYAQFVAKEIGFVTKIEHGVHSSDCTPFAHKGVPSIGFMRDGQAAGHNRYDKPWPLDGRMLAEVTDYAINMVDRIDNAKFFPFSRVITEDMAKKLDDYINPKD